MRSSQTTRFTSRDSTAIDNSRLVTGLVTVSGNRGPAKGENKKRRTRPTLRLRPVPNTSERVKNLARKLLVSLLDLRVGSGVRISDVHESEPPEIRAGDPIACCRGFVGSRY